MGCIKRPTKYFFGLFSGFGPHEWEIQELGVFMPRSFTGNYIVMKKCKHCGLLEKDSFVTGEELMHKGVTAEQLESAREHEMN